MIVVRRSDERGHAQHGWLESWHSFSFADYYDPEHMSFRDLRVINEDIVQPSQGFGMHPHRSMEIVTYILEGSLQHRDSMGNGSVIRPGEIQRMSAGTGVLHSEFNPSDSEPVHLLQIWILPARQGGTPGYEEKRFEPSELANRLKLIASPEAEQGSVRIGQDARIFAGRFEPGARARLELAQGRHAWVQVARGELLLNGERLKAGDGAAVSGESLLEIEGVADGRGSEALVFDLR